ncbi:MAG TPA: adenylate/guanylate cyclase domain-containing protein [Thermoplasmata archaeon]|nr:adenylate/guanylate cyclase domain-containing protein [Thermoplasmata archaeon]
MKVPEVKYAKSGEIHVAYQTVGNGPVDIVLGLPYVSHLGVWWELPSAADFFTRLAGIGRVIMFDKRGLGLSDRAVGIPTLEERMDDFRAVMDAANSRKAVILGVSESGAMSILFAAAYPERVAGLVLAGTYARQAWAPDYPWGNTPEESESWIRSVESEWGKAEFVDRYARDLAPARAPDPEFAPWLGRLLTYGASPASAVAVTKMDDGIDVREVLAAVHVPTLILADKTEWGAHSSEYLAEHIPGAQLLVIPGANHMFFVVPEATRMVLDSIRSFVDEIPGGPEPERVLTTVLFTDIVGSTRRAAEMGDRSWGKLLDRYFDGARNELARYQGRLVKTTGDGMLATFDGPTRAIRCACALRDLAKGAGLEIRAGLHSGECILKDKDVQGIAVHIASRVSERAGDSEVLVSGTVRDLSIGSDIRFADRGSHSLKGLEGEWRMYSVAST